MRQLALVIWFVFPVLSFGQQIDLLLAEKLDSTAEAPIHGISFYLKTPKKEVVKTVGNSEPNAQFRIASSTKIFVAALILKLEDERELNISDPLSKHLSSIKGRKLNEFYEHLSIEEANKVTIKQLLSHRSGIADIFTDTEDEFLELLIQNTQKQYTPATIIDLYFQLNTRKFSSSPSTNTWHYSDMNYVLLGLLLEHLEQKPLHEIIRDELLAPLNMNDTYFEFYESPTPDKPATQQFVGNINFSQVNTSFDWAGGGLVSTHQDLAAFISALFNGKVLSPESLSKMMETKATTTNESPYGLGLYKTIYAGEEFFGHYGFYGTYIGYSPKSNTTLSYCINQAQPDIHVYQFINQLVKLTMKE